MIFAQFNQDSSRKGLFYDRETSNVAKVRLQL